MDVIGGGVRVQQRAAYPAISNEITKSADKRCMLRLRRSDVRVHGLCDHVASVDDDVRRNRRNTWLVK